MSSGVLFRLALSTKGVLPSALPPQLTPALGLLLTTTRMNADGVLPSFRGALRGRTVLKGGSSLRLQTGASAANGLLVRTVLLRVVRGELANGLVAGVEVAAGRPGLSATGLDGGVCSASTRSAPNATTRTMAAMEIVVVDSARLGFLQHGDIRSYGLEAVKSPF